jgi:hypothetical protein
LAPVPEDVDRPAAVPAPQADLDPLAYGVDKWAQDRLVNPVPHVVYLIRCATPATFYVGISRDFATRLAAHQANARRLTVDGQGDLQAYPYEPSVAFMMRHGFDRVEDVVSVPDRVAAIAVEIAWTKALAETGFTVFGNNPDPTRSWWNRNEVRPS